MSVNANVLSRSGLIESAAHSKATASAEIFGETRAWDPKDFAREQIRGLVRRVFFADPGEPVKQVVFSPAEPGTDVGIICDQVGRALARETSAEIAILSRTSTADTGAPHDRGLYSERAGIKSWSSRMAPNLWRVPESGLRDRCPEAATGRYWLWALVELRNDFEYVVIQGPEARFASESALIGQLTDGIILVLEAHSTRRATARKIKEALEGTQSRILGTVLSERTFPVPEGLYRRL